YTYYGSDASAALHAGADIRNGLFGAGIVSSHAMERTHIDSIKSTEKLLYAYCLSPIEKTISVDKCERPMEYNEL
ncbi:hypothetical protein Q0P03_15020, partial [Staphylococcus aureus]|nr:hypothetical protein [Staphylococcus aureus]